MKHVNVVTRTLFFLVLCCTVCINSMHSWLSRLNICRILIPGDLETSSGLNSSNGRSSTTALVNRVEELSEKLSVLHSDIELLKASVRSGRKSLLSLKKRKTEDNNNFCVKIQEMKKSFIADKQALKSSLLQQSIIDKSNALSAQRAQFDREQQRLKSELSSANEGVVLTVKEQLQQLQSKNNMHELTICDLKEKLRTLRRTINSQAERLQEFTKTTTPHDSLTHGGQTHNMENSEIVGHSAYSSTYGGGHHRRPGRSTISISNLARSSAQDEDNRQPHANSYRANGGPG